jgi:hypothetical protein
MSGVQQQHARADQLVLGEPVAFVEHVGECGDQVLARARATLPREHSQILGELDARAHRVALGIDRWVELVQLADVGRPRPQQMTVRLRHAEDLGDHGDGERLGDRRQEVELPGARDRVGEPVGDALHCGRRPSTNAGVNAFDTSRRTRV